MKTIYVRDIMVPLSDYATVSKDATLMEAIQAIQRKDEDKLYFHRSVLVLDDKGEVIGKISQIDILRSLEPNYFQIGEDLDLGRFGFSSSFMKAIRREFKLWERPVTEICRTAKTMRAADVMYTPADHQRVRESDTLDGAMHQIVLGRHQSLLVTRDKKIVGILRSTDAFNALYDMIEEAQC